LSLKVHMIFILFYHLKFQFWQSCFFTTIFGHSTERCTSVERPKGEGVGRYLRGYLGLWGNLGGPQFSYFIAFILKQNFKTNPFPLCPSLSVHLLFDTEFFCNSKKVNSIFFDCVKVIEKVIAFTVVILSQT
jgi:hypothetical protein